MASPGQTQCAQLDPASTVTKNIARIATHNKAHIRTVISSQTTDDVLTDPPGLRARPPGFAHLTA